MDIREFVIANTERGECKCGLCIDRGNKPDPEGHTVDTGFFLVAIRPGTSPSADDFKKLTEQFTGEFHSMNPFDGNPHDFIEIGAWIGDQGLAMQYMALGVLLQLFIQITPQIIIATSDELKELMRREVPIAEGKN